jgi:hypothetical protein
MGGELLSFVSFFFVIWYLHHIVLSVVILIGISSSRNECRLNKMGWEVKGCCHFCKQHPETQQHLF